MIRFAILLGDAPEDFRQKKLEDMFNFLDSKRNAGDSIVTFANGISELMLEMVLDNSVKQLADAVVETAVSEPRRSSETSSRNECHSELVSESARTRHPEFISGSAKDLLSEGAKQHVHHDNNVNVKGVNDSLQVQHDDIRNSNSILLYICTKSPVKESDKSVWLGGEEIRRDVILHYQALAEKCGVDMQVVMDFDAELLSEDELGWEKTVPAGSTNFINGGTR